MSDKQEFTVDSNGDIVGIKIDQYVTYTNNSTSTSELIFPYLAPGSSITINWVPNDTSHFGWQYLYPQLQEPSLWFWREALEIQEEPVPERYEIPEKQFLPKVYIRPNAKMGRKWK